jgi:hypothetical protein
LFLFCFIKLYDYLIEFYNLLFLLGWFYWVGFIGLFNYHEENAPLPNASLAAIGIKDSIAIPIPGAAAPTNGVWSS